MMITANSHNVSDYEMLHDKRSLPRTLMLDFAVLSQVVPDQIDSYTSPATRSTSGGIIVGGVRSRPPSSVK
jgi:hypothetical protein